MASSWAFLVHLDAFDMVAYEGTADVSSQEKISGYSIHF